MGGGVVLAASAVTRCPGYYRGAIDHGGTTNIQCVESFIPEYFAGVDFDGNQLPCALTDRLARLA